MSFAFGMPFMGGFQNYNSPSNGFGKMTPDHSGVSPFQTSTSDYYPSAWPTGYQGYGMFAPMNQGMSSGVPTNSSGSRSNIIIDEASFTPQELRMTHNMLDYLHRDPDGSLMLRALTEKYPNGFLITQDDNLNSQGYQNEDHIIMGKIDLNDPQRFLATLSHEMLHAITPEQIPNSANQEAYEEVLGHRIAERYGGDMTSWVYGNPITVDGSQAAEKALYEATMLDASAPNGRWAAIGQQNPFDPNYERMIELLGFQFDV